MEREFVRRQEDMRTLIEEPMSGSGEMGPGKGKPQGIIGEITMADRERSGLYEKPTIPGGYAASIVDTLRVPLMVLDGNLRINSANRSYYRYFKVSEKDTEGKLIYELGNGQWDIPALQNLLKYVLPHRSAFEDFIVTWNFPHIGQRTMLLNANEIISDNEEEKLILLSFEDITDKAESGNKENELLGRFENLLMKAPVAIMVLRGPNYVVEFANDTYLRIVEKEKDFIGRPLFESLPELVPRGIRELLDGVMHSGVTYHGNELAVRMSREEKIEKGFYNFVYHPIRDDMESVRRIIVVASEVTEQVLARKRVEESEFRYKEMIHSSPSLIAILEGADFILTVANDAIFDQLGKGKTILGKPYLTVVPELEDQGLGDLLRKVYSTGEPYVANEMPVSLLRNGKLELSYYNFVYHAQRNINGDIEGVAIIANEVSPQAVLNKTLRESESHFRQMADLMPAKISNADIGGNVIYFNKNWLEFTGLDFEELKELGYHKIMHPDEMEEFGNRIQKALETGTDLEMEMRFLNKAGDYVWHLNIASPVKDEYGNFKMWIGVTTHITEQIKTRKSNLETYEKHSNELEEQVMEGTIELKAANNRLLDGNAELKRTNKELEAFTFGASHDLQEPLRKIQTFIERISNGESNGLTDRGKEYFVRIQEVSGRMRHLIDDLLEFAKLGSAERIFIKTDLGKITGEVIKELQETIDEKQAFIESIEMVELKVIPFQFHQLMHNLIGNALKFSIPDIPSYIKINSRIAKGSTLEKKDLYADMDYCQITVEDNGIGFKPEYGEQIFEVFKRLHGKEAYPGTGMGLATVKRIVEIHNGTMTVKSNLDQGARFDIYIPVP